MKDEQRLEELVLAVKSRGIRVTPQRREILRILLATKHRSAREIHDLLQEKYPGISFDTVYRNLSLLCRIGLLVELNFHEGFSRYELKTGPHHHHHFICLGCGDTEEFDYCPLPLGLPPELSGWKVVTHTFELFGYCHKCL